MFSGGIGLNVDSIAPFMMKQWTEATQKEYHCSFFKEMQKEMKEQGEVTAGMSMATGMAAGVRGIAFSLLSLTMDDSEAAAEPNMPKDVDAIISLSAKDPVALLQMASAMLPPLAEMKIPADGTPTPIPLPVPLPFTPMAAVKGSHLTVYAGEQAGKLADDLAKADLEASPGLMAIGFDYGKYYGLMGEILPEMGEEETEETKLATDFIDALKNAKLQASMTVDVTDQGIEMRAEARSEE